MSDAVITLIILALMAAGLVTEILPLAITAMGGAYVLSLFGIIEKKEVFSALSGSTIILLGATMIIGGAIFHSGLADKLSNKIVKLTGATEQGIMIACMVVALFFSSVCSGTSVVAMMLPIVVAMCMKANIPLSRNMIILSFSSSIGCNLTLVGAASNVSAAGMVEELTGQPFLSFFDLGKVGLPLCAIFAVYFLTVGKRSLRPNHEINQEYVSDLMVSAAKAQDNFDIRKAAITAVVLIITFVAMGFNSSAYPMYWVAGAGCVVLCLTGCISTKDAARAIDWDTIFIVCGMTALTNAMTASGAGELIANGVTSLLGSTPNKMLVLFVFLVTTMFLTNLMMNTSTVLLVTPLFIPIAISIGMNPVAAGVAICVGANSPFLTPVGSPTNTMVVKPGNLEFMDFFVPGAALSIITVVVSMITIPIFFPL